MSIPKEKIEILKALSNIANDGLTREEFLRAFKLIKDYVESIEKKLLEIVGSKKLDETNNLNKLYSELDQSIAKANKDIEEKLKQIKDGKTPVKGIDYFDGKDADEKRIIESVLSHIKQPKDGEDGKDADEDMVVKKVLEQMPDNQYFESEVEKLREDLRTAKRLKGGGTSAIGVEFALKRIGISTSIVTKTSDYTITNNDGVILGDASSGILTFTLPTAVGNEGRRFNVKKIDSTLNKITVAASGSETIDSDSTFDVELQDESITIISNNQNWYII